MARSSPVIATLLLTCVWLLIASYIVPEPKLPELSNFADDDKIYVNSPTAIEIENSLEASFVTHTSVEEELHDIKIKDSTTNTLLLNLSDKVEDLVETEFFQSTNSIVSDIHSIAEEINRDSVTQEQIIADDSNSDCSCSNSTDTDEQQTANDKKVPESYRYDIYTVIFSFGGAIAILWYCGLVSPISAPANDNNSKKPVNSFPLGKDAFEEEDVSPASAKTGLVSHSPFVSERHSSISNS